MTEHRIEEDTPLVAQLLLTMSQAARVLHVGRTTVYGLINDGALRHGAHRPQLPHHPRRARALRGQAGPGTRCGPSRVRRATRPSRAEVRPLRSSPRAVYLPHVGRRAHDQSRSHQEGVPAMTKARAANGRSSIYLGADGRWHGRVSMGTDPATGNAIRRQVTAKTQAEATRKVRALEKDREQRPPSANAVARVTVRTYLDRWIENRASLGVRYNTVLGYRTDTQHIFAAFGGVRLDKLTVDHIEALWRQMSAIQPDGRTRIGSISHVRRTLNAALSDAVKRGYLLRNPVGLARTPKHVRKPIEPYTVEEVRQLFAAAAGGRHSARWTIGAVVGLRQGEVLGLQWSDLDVPAGTLTVSRQLQRRLWEHGCPADRAVRPQARDELSAAARRRSGHLRTEVRGRAAGDRAAALGARRAGSAPESASRRTSGCCALGRRRLDVPERARPSDGSESRLLRLAGAVRRGRRPSPSAARSAAHLGDVAAGSEGRSQVRRPSPRPWHDRADRGLYARAR